MKIRSNWEKFEIAARAMRGVVIITAVAFVILLIFLGCQWIDRAADIRRPTASELSATRDQRTAQYMIESMVYFKDDRTGLCFATTANSEWGSLACVPCESVQNLLVPQPEPEQQPQQ